MVPHVTGQYKLSVHRGRATDDTLSVPNKVRLQKWWVSRCDSGTYGGTNTGLDHMSDLLKNTEGKERCRQGPSPTGYGNMIMYD
jgi:hypothetical protein